jgi:hypothetical protein
LVVVEPGLVLAGSEAFFDGPARSGHANEFSDSGVVGVVASVERELAGVDGSADQILMVGVIGVDECPVVDAEPCRSDTARSALPRMRGQSLSECIEGSGVPPGVGELGGLRYGHHIGDVMCFEELAQARVLTELLIGGEPGEGHTRPQRGLDHLLHLLRPGLEGHLRGDTSRLAAGRVGHPGLLRQVQPTVEQHPVPARCDVGQERGDLAVINPSERPGVLPLHTHRLRSFFGKPGRISDQDRLR